MIRKIGWTTLLAGLLVSTIASAGDLAGTWIVQPLSPLGVIPTSYVFKQRHGALGGIWRRGFIDVPLRELKLEGDKVSFIVDVSDDYFLTMHGTVTGAELYLAQTGSSGSEYAPVRAHKAAADDLVRLARDTPRNMKKGRLPLPPLHEVPANGLARLPPMGWNSWNQFAEKADDRLIREVADAMVASGLRDAGYVYVNIDGGWQGMRDAKGALHPNAKFPDMKSLADFVHSRGLKLGLYSSPGPVACGDYIGSHGYEREDAAMFASWGVDLLKYDWCSAGALYKTQADMRAVYQKMGDALHATGRPIVYSLCQYGLFDVGSWGRAVGANLWRTGEDLVAGDRWANVSRNGFETHGNPDKSGPGGWNDADILVIGMDGLTDAEARTHMTLWSILASPLLLGNDVRNMSPAIRGLLLNREVIAIDQDALGKQGRLARRSGSSEIWIKPLADGSTAIAIFNRGESPAEIDVRWLEIGLPGAHELRDLWEHTDLGRYPDGYHVLLPAHGSSLLRATLGH